MGKQEYGSKSSEPLRPILKYAGGKSWLIPKIKELWNGNEQRQLVEPFVGGMSVALGLLPGRALLADANPYVINLYECVKRGFYFHNDWEFRNDEEFFYGKRFEFNCLRDDPGTKRERIAYLFYYLNRTTYNGLCRFNKRGKFNAPFGAYKNINYATDFQHYTSALRDWDFYHQDFTTTLDQADPDSFVYADPPFDESYAGYCGDGFSWKQQEILADRLSKHAGPVVASNLATNRIIALYRDLGFNLSFVSAPRRISSDGNRKPALEMLATRNLPFLRIVEDLDL